MNKSVSCVRSVTVKWVVAFCGGVSVQGASDGDGLPSAGEDVIPDKPAIELDEPTSEFNEPAVAKKPGDACAGMLSGVGCGAGGVIMYIGICACGMRDVRGRTSFAGELNAL
ncbi:hypothetical protein EDD73_10817 [Heliophilum fasciatum]|uniref:Uncharacterized protein n=1 Tax=Heliophilum fasciatum TaxID=35700 RepID=A0A4R2RNL8_9FIRM|nr:hypothetical protein EDD73_10817 [Heliophilum fasciatum]